MNPVHPSFRCCRLDTLRHSLTGSTAMSEEMYLDVLGGNFSCCTRISFQKIWSSCGTSIQTFVTAKHQCFWCGQNIDEKQDPAICKVRVFWCFSPEVPRMFFGGQLFCLILLTKESIQMACSVTEWRSDPWTACKFGQPVWPKIQIYIM